MANKNNNKKAICFVDSKGNPLFEGDTTVKTELIVEEVYMTDKEGNILDAVAAVSTTPTP